MWISIHALVKRATYRRFYGDRLCKHFNPRPREEGDFFGGIHCLKSDYFNPRPREEGDFRVRERLIFRQYFNPRPREEGDYFPSLPAQKPPIFQSMPS